MEEVEKIESISSRVSGEVREHSGKGVEVFLVLFFLAGTAVFLAGTVKTGILDPDSTVGNQREGQAPDSYNSRAEVIVGMGELNPSELKVEAGGEVVFRNKAGRKMSISFERNHEDMVLQKGESRSLEFNSPVYYTASPFNSELKAYGSVEIK